MTSSWWLVDVHYLHLPPIKIHVNPHDCTGFWGIIGIIGFLKDSGVDAETQKVRGGLRAFGPWPVKSWWENAQEVPQYVQIFMQDYAGKYR